MYVCDGRIGFVLLLLIRNTGFRQRNVRYVCNKFLYEKTVRWYECANCPCKSKAKIHLRRHVKIHLEIKQYQCDFCLLYETNHSVLLKRHINCDHVDGTDVKEYKCEHCPYKSQSRLSFYKHKTKHVGIQLIISRVSLY